MIIDDQSLEGLKRCDYESISHIQTVLGGILRTINNEPSGSTEANRFDPYWKPLQSGSLANQQHFDFYENDVIDIWEALIEGALRPEAKKERSSLIYLASKLQDLPWQSGEIRDSFSSLLLLSLKREGSETGQALSDIEARILDIKEGRTGMDNEAIETYLGLAKKAILKTYDSNRGSDHGMAVRAVEMLGRIGDEEARDHLRSILYSMTSPSAAQRKADVILRGPRIENELQSAEMTRRVVLTEYPEDSPQAYFIKTVYEAVSIVLGQKDAGCDTDKPEVLMAIKVLTSVTENQDRMKQLLEAQNLIENETDGIPVTLDLGAFERTEGRDGRVRGEGWASWIIRDIKFDIENALLHTMTSENKILREEAIFGISNISNDRVESILSKMVDRYSPRSEVGSGAQRALTKIANKKALAGMDWDDCEIPGQPLPSPFMAIARTRDTVADAPNHSQPNKNVAQTVKRAGR